MAGLSSTGYSIKRLNDIIAEMKADAETQFASLVAPGDIVNTSDTSVLGRWIKTVAAPLADLWEQTQSLYSSFDLDQASNEALENITTLGGVTRKGATASTARLVLSGTYGTIIPTDSMVKSGSTGRVFATDSEVTLDETLCVAVTFSPTSVSNSTAYSFTYQIVGINSSPVSVSITSDSSATSGEIVTALINKVNTDHSTYLNASLSGSSVYVAINNQTQNCTFTLSQFTISKVKKGVSSTCTETGVNPQIADSIQSIQSPVIGWETATNPYEAIPGTVVESDADLRSRYILAKFQDSLNTYEAIYAAVLKVSGVTQVIIYENETDTAYISPPVPAHSFYPIVLGGNDADIAKAIWDNKPAGIRSYGGTSVDVVDSQGVAHAIGFDRPTDLDIYIDIEVTALDTYPVDGDDQIKTAVMEYINSLNIGEDILYSRLYSPVNGVKGHYVNTLVIGTAPSPSSTSNITVDYNKMAVLTAANINVTHV